MLKIAEEKIREAKIKNIDTLKIDKHISEIDNKFSAIITLMTLHHILNIDDFFSHASKLLDDDGALIIADLHKEDGSFHEQIPDFVGHNGFEIKSLSQKLERAGFNVSQISSYYEIEKEISPDQVKKYQLFFLVAEKQNK